MAVQFLNKWGCEVWALGSSDSKREEASKLGAHHVVNSREAGELEKLANTLDFILVAVNVPQDWKALVSRGGALQPGSRFDRERAPNCGSATPAVAWVGASARQRGRNLPHRVGRWCATSGTVR